jgi:hypothetical protein
MKPAFGVVEPRRRHLVWMALGELYLDTELSAHALQHMAKVLAASGYTWAEIKAINYDEVAPALWFNVQDVAGEWAGWDEEWLVKRIGSMCTGRPHRTLGSARLWRKRVDSYTAAYLAEIALYMR